MLPKRPIILAILTALYAVAVILILYSVIAAFKMDQPSRGIVCPECKQPKNAPKLK